MNIGTPLKPGATKLLLLGSGELGKEVAIEAQRLGVEVIAVDRYPRCPGHAGGTQESCHQHAGSGCAAPGGGRRTARPDRAGDRGDRYRNSCWNWNRRGQRVIPTARATNLTMNREGIRRLAAEELGLAHCP